MVSEYYAKQLAWRRNNPDKIKQYNKTARINRMKKKGTKEEEEAARIAEEKAEKAELEAIGKSEERFNNWLLTRDK
jgi:hypothetical protein